MNLKSRKSFTLTEVVVSVLTLALIWLAAVNALIVGKYSASYAKHKIQAAYIAQQEIERLRKFNYSTLPAQAGTFNDVLLDAAGTPATRIITIAAQGVGHDYSTVIIRIRWNELFFGVTKQMNEYCGTYIANSPKIN